MATYSLTLRQDLGRRLTILKNKEAILIKEKEYRENMLKLKTDV